MLTPILKKGTGWKPQRPDFRDHVMKLERPGVEQFQDTDFRPLFDPPLDQGNSNSCTAHGISSAIRYRRKVENLPDFQPSRLFIYWNERLQEGTQNQDDGGVIRDGIISVAKYGAPQEVLWPFDLSKITVEPDQFSFDAALGDLVAEYQSVPVTKEDVLTALSHNYPVVFGVTLYESFENDVTAQNGEVPMPSQNEKVIGGHCMLIVGAQISNAKFIVRNSWGTDWGDEGYCYIPFDYILNENLASDFWIIQTIKT